MHTILLVEPNADSRNQIKSWLVTEGYIVHDTGQGSKALEIANNIPIDLIITAIFLEDLDGLLLIPAIQKDHRGMPIIAISERKSVGRIDLLYMARTPGAKKTLSHYNKSTLVRRVASLLRDAA